MILLKSDPKTQTCEGAGRHLVLSAIRKSLTNESINDMLIQIYGAARALGQRSITPPQSVVLAGTVACNETEERMKGGVEHVGGCDHQQTLSLWWKPHYHQECEVI